MSVSITWRPLSLKDNYLSVGAPSSFSSRLELPREFDETDIQFLYGFAKGTSDPAENAAVHELIDAICEHKKIVVEVSY